MALQWYILPCPACATVLRARLSQPLTPLSCVECGEHFCAYNAHLAAHPPKKPPALRAKPKWSRLGRAYRVHMSSALKRQNEQQPEATRAVRFQARWASGTRIAPRTRSWRSRRRRR